ncbi:MAG: hypothetical protein ACKOC4_14535 [Planctomycetia bacterium]
MPPADADPTMQPAAGAAFADTLRALRDGDPGLATNAWTDLDAARFYVASYDPEAINALPPQLVLGVVARLVLERLAWHDTLGDQARALVRRPELLPWDATYAPQHLRGMFFSAGLRMSWNPLVAGLAEFVEPPSGGHGRPGSAPCAAEPVRMCLCPGEFPCGMGLCHAWRIMPTWRTTCMTAAGFQHAVACGMLVPWAQVPWAGLACLLTPLRFATDVPTVVVPTADGHVGEPYVPRHVAAALRRLDATIPSLLLELRRWDERFNADLRSHLERLAAERLRYWATRVGASDSRARMEQWDQLFSSSCWCLGGRDRVYDDFWPALFGLTADAHEHLADTQPADLFPPLAGRPPAEHG